MTVRIGIVGHGWRAEFFRRLTAGLPGLELVGAVVRRPQAAAELAARWQTAVYSSTAELVAHQKPGVVISCVSVAANAGVTVELVGAGVRVLCETPPAADAAAMSALWQAVGAGGRDLVHVAEQYPLMPMHLARAAVVAGGVIGTPSQVQVSSTHTYHAVALMRGLLGADSGPTRVTASAITADLVDPLTRDGWSDDDVPRPATTTLAVIDFGAGRSGIYDFTDNQWHNRLRHRRIVIRGSHGEIVDDDVVRLAGAQTVLRSRIGRHQLGYDLDLDGYDTELISHDGRVVWRNPVLGRRSSDEELAITEVLLRTAGWARDETPGPYPLAQACQDHLVGLAVEQSLRAGAPVVTEVEAWARR